MTLDDMLDAAASGRPTIAPGWGQGRATYGGLVAGLLVARAEALREDASRRLRSASLTFAGPVTPGVAELDGAVLRAGSSATQVDVRLLQDGAVRAVLLATFGDDRPSRIAVDPAPRAPRPELPPPEAVDRLPHVPGMTPDFFTNVDLRYAAGAPPFSSAAEPDFGGWMRFADPPRAFGDRELVTLADAWPPAVLPMLDRPTAMSSVAWTFEPVGAPPSPGDAPDAYWQYDVRTHAAAGGYAQTTARIWDAAGGLRALSHQTIAVFA